MNAIEECKKAAIGKTITNVSVYPNGKFWTLELSDGNWIGFEPLNEGRVCMQYGGSRPNDPSSPTPAQAGEALSQGAEKGVRCSAWLGDDEEAKLRNSIDRYMAEYIKRNLQSPQ